MLSDKYRKVRDAAADALAALEKHPEIIAILEDVADCGGYDVLDMLDKLANMEKDEDITKALSPLAAP